jgi:phospholipid/cholesterol/gamma-HCH transport system permease protein
LALKIKSNFKNKKFIQTFSICGKRCIGILSYLGGLSVLTFKTIKSIFTNFIRKNLVIDQLNKVGVNSILIIFLITIFTGIVLALQSAYALKQFEASIYIPAMVALSITRELGPVLTALIIAGKVGASMTAEIGTMKVTEQIDALESLAADPVSYLVVPRFFALLIAVPILTIYGDLVGIFGGYLVGVTKLGISSRLYINLSVDSLVYKDVGTGLIKSVFFAMVIALVSCYEGMRTKGGAEGVGRSTTMSVVISFILILTLDCFFTALFYFVFP